MKKEPISSIPAKCGFSDYNAFYRSFKKNYGVNPREYVAYHLKAIHGEVGGLSLDIDHQSTESWYIPRREHGSTEEEFSQLKSQAAHGFMADVENRQLKQ